jgi:hypothetical protein
MVTLGFGGGSFGGCMMRLLEDTLDLLRYVEIVINGSRVIVNDVLKWQPTTQANEASENRARRQRVKVVVA